MNLRVEGARRKRPKYRPDVFRQRYPTGVFPRRSREVKLPDACCRGMKAGYGTAATVKDSAFVRRGGLESLSASEWQRGGIHLGRGRLTLGDWVASLAGHDDNHLDQFHRTLAGRP